MRRPLRTLLPRNPIISTGGHEAAFQECPRHSASANGLAIVAQANRHHDGDYFRTSRVCFVGRNKVRSLILKMERKCHPSTLISTTCLTILALHFALALVHDAHSAKKAKTSALHRLSSRVKWKI